MDRKTIRQIQAGIDAMQASLTASDQEESDTRRLADIARCDELLQNAVKPQSGTLFQGRFEQIELIGEGTYGIVYRAREIELNRQVAIKLLRPSLHLAKSSRRRFELEGITLAKCCFAGIVPVFEIGNLQETPFIVMKYAEGNLSDYLQRLNSPLPTLRAVEIIEQIAISIHKAHQQGIIHRDLKPSNILIDSKDKDSLDPSNLLISDFGLARDLSAGSAKLTGTDDRHILGTVAYMSPEQAKGNTGATTVASDIYSIGVVFFELLTLRTPFCSGSRLEILHGIAYENAPSVRSLRREVPYDLGCVVAKCLAREPSDRYASAQELQADLRAWREGRPVSASQSQWQQLKKWVFHNQVVSLFSIALVLSLALGLLTSLKFYFDGQRQLEKALKETERADANLQLVLDSATSLYDAAERILRNEPQSNEKKLELYQLALKSAEAFAVQSSYDQASRRRLSIALHSTANAAQQVDQKKLEREYRKRQYQLLLQFAEESPNDAKYQFDLFHNRFWHAVSFNTDKSLLIDARRHLDIAITLAPDRPEYRQALATLLLHQAIHVADSEERRKQIREAIQIAQQLAASLPDNLLYLQPIVRGKLALANDFFHKNELSESKVILSSLLQDADFDRIRKLDEWEFLSNKHEALQILIEAELKQSSQDFVPLFDRFVENLLLLIQQSKYQKLILLPAKYAVQYAERVSALGERNSAIHCLKQAERLTQEKAWQTESIAAEAQSLMQEVRQKLSEY